MLGQEILEFPVKLLNTKELKNKSCLCMRRKSMTTKNKIYTHSKKDRDVSQTFL